jgi:hypothetical protein
VPHWLSCWSWLALALQKRGSKKQTRRRAREEDEVDEAAQDLSLIDVNKLLSRFRSLFFHKLQVKPEERSKSSDSDSDSC